MLAYACAALALLGLAARGSADKRPAPDLLAAADKDQAAEDKAKPAGPVGVQGRLIRVPLPLAGNVDQRVKGMIQRAADRFLPSDDRPVIVLEFSPGQAGNGEGSVYSRITIARAAFKDATTDIEARKVVLEWLPGALLRREARIGKLAIASLRIKTAGSDPAKPPQMPASLRLPLDASVADARIQRLEIENVGVVQDVHFRLRARAQTHELELINISASGARAAGVQRPATISWVSEPVTRGPPPEGGCEPAPR